MKRCFLVAQEDVDVMALIREMKAGDAVLPLTSAAQATCVNTLGNVRYLSQFVPHHRICELALRAQELLVQFTAEACQGATLDGIDWLQGFIEDQKLLYFREVLMAQELAPHLGAEFEEIILLGMPNISPGAPLHGFIEVLKLHLRERVATWSHLLVKRDDRMLRKAQKKLGAGFRRLNNFLASSAEPAGVCKGIGVFSTSQWERFTEPLLELRDLYGDQFQIWYLGPIPGKLHTWANEAALRVTTIPYPQRVDRDVREFFNDHWNRWISHRRHELARKTGCPSFANEAFLPFLEQLFNYTLPRTVQWARSLRHFLRRASPGWILGSAAYTYMSKFPYYVAKKMDIPSIALSHTSVSGDYGVVPATYLVCKNLFERKGYQGSFVDDGSILYCRNSSNRLSYVANDSMSIPESHRPIVAVLTAPATGNGSVMPWTDDAQCVTTLKTLGNPSQDLSDLDFIFKSHPRFDISSFLQRVAVAPNVRVLPAQASVTELLEKAWVIVVCNHYGSVVAEAAMNGKPILFLDSAHFFYPYIDPMGFAAGEVVKDMDTFWRLLRNIKVSPEVYSKLAERCQSFRSRYLQPSTLTLAEQLKILENEKIRVG